MFNLFKNSNEGSNSYPKIVEEIHNEFFTASDKILEEAISVLKECESVSLDKGKRLASIGFNKVPEAVKVIEYEKKITINKEIAELVNYYKINYPFNKFITESQVKSICEKYGLVLGDVSLYKGFVPENKLSKIEQFSLIKKDESFFTVYDSSNNIIGYIQEQDCDKKLLSYMYRKESDNYIYITGSNGNKLSYNFEVPDYELYKELPFVKAVREIPSFKICAPLKDMEVPNTKMVNGYKIENIPDPVVLQPIRGGYLIVAAWGDEASDETLVNEISN